MSSKVWAILWKNLLLRRNAWAITLYEIIFPLGLLVLINLWVPAIPKIRPVPVPLGDAIPIFKFDTNVIYSPSNEFTDNVINHVAGQFRIKRSNILEGNITRMKEGNADFGIELGNSSKENLVYTFYPGPGSWPQSLPSWQADSSSFEKKYGLLTLAQVQYSIDRACLAALQGNFWYPEITVEDVSPFGIEVDPYAILVILAIFMSYTFLVSPVITRIVEEKECGAKELMRMMGVEAWQLWVGKLLDALAVILLVSLGMVLLVYIPLTSSSTVMNFVSPLIFFTMLVLGFTSIILGLFFLSCFFDSPVMASSVASLIGVSSALLLGFLSLTSVAWWRRMLYCLLPHMALISSAHILLKFEFYEKNVHWLERLSADGNDLTLLEVTIMMIVDIIIYSLLTWYFDKVKPGKYGIPRPWNFFLQKGYCFRERKVTSEAKLLKKGTDEKHPGIYVNQLRKVYRTLGQNPLVAVDCLNLDAPEGRITALLGHNGAGKTTTMQIITGLIPATSGSVSICGVDIKSDPDLARSSLGLCPQQDLLFQNLTALQTLTFFAMIKGLSYKEGQKEAEELLKILKMQHVKNKENKDLSGGMKRKVSLGIALIGGSRVLILDEPTAGVDPELRREICDLLLSYRGKRTVLLTTHIMEEADAISDLIYIMDHGKVQCFGTPLDLKTKFGTGYTLQVVVKKEDISQVLEAVKSTIPDSRFKARNAATLSFQLPSVRTPLFPELFAKMDDMKEVGEIVSYSVSISTLEDVFLRVREIEKEGSDEADGNPYVLLASNTELHPGKLTGLSLWYSQFRAIFIKAWLTFSRSYWLFFTFSAIPFGLIIFGEVIAAFLAQNVEPISTVKSVNYSIPMYEGMEILYNQTENCGICDRFGVQLKIEANNHGFNVREVSNIDEAVMHLVEEDFHKFSRNLALTLELTDKTIRVRYNSLATNMLSVGINIIHNVNLQLGGGPKLSSGVDLMYSSVPKYMPRGAPSQGDSSFLQITGFQTLYYVNQMLTERQTGAKALQLMAVPALIFWVSQFFFDLLTFLPFISISTLVYYFFEPNDPIFIRNDFPLTIVLWGGGLILASYVITCYIKTRSNAITVAILVYFVFGTVMWTLIATSLVPMWLAFFHPTTIWKRANLYPQQYDQIWQLLSYWAAMIAFLVLTESTIPSRVFHSLLSSLCRVKYGGEAREIDGDVENEAGEVSALIHTPERAHDTLLVSRLRRWYGIFKPKPAVRGVSFRVFPGECFGLLGVNGAGKSSTFNMLATQIPCSDGDAVLNNSHLSDWNTNQYLSQVSYCPQTSGIVPKLTGREFLTLFARLRGYKEVQVADTVFQWTRILDLEDCSERRCGTYSGGMQRKLMAAAAFVWDASVVMLDEPTSGVDPVARRSIWQAVTTAQQANKSIVLTSHSMEECEALCSRLAIMVDGSFRCIGETTTLKSKFGGGFSVQLKMSPCTPEQLTDFEKAVSDVIGAGCQLTDRHCSILHYHIDDRRMNWKTLFGKLEHLKSSQPLMESYMASETTLEQIFLDFAGHKRIQTRAETVVDISE